MYEQELPSNLDDFPNYNLKQSAESEKIIVDNDQKKKAAYQFMQSLEKNLRTKISSPQQRIQTIAVSLELYDTIFNKIYCNTLYKETLFPLAETLEEAFNDEFDSITKLLFNESCYRHAFQSVQQQFNLQTSIESWQNYQLLFAALQQKQNIDLPLPPSWIWDILDEYVYQFYVSSRWRKLLKNDEINQLKNIQDFWNLEEMLKTLEAFYTQRNSSVQNTLQYLAFYSYLAAAKLHVMSGNFQVGYTLLSQIQHSELIIYSKSGGAYQSLFSYTGFCFLLNKEYKKANLTLTLIVNYFNKFKQLYTKSYQYDSLIKQHEKILALLAVTSLYYPEIEDNIITLLKESRNKLFEKYEKMLKYDLQVIGEILLQSCPKIINTIKNLKEFQTEQEVNPNEIIMDMKDKLLKEVLEAKKINEVEQVLSLYNQITFQHFNKLLPEKYIQLYIERNNVILNENSFESSVLSKFWQKSKLLDIEIQKDIIHVKEVQINQRDFINQLAQMNANLEKTFLELSRNL
ncbi:unnamed protein product [Paramecium pentaurelia]|uniref:Eukaryotic translation initiation factor 3 subunit L n=1 Tax=Paramecium pentaurelia TaxID=43138 RepID=A0A8S1XNR7_9CILI|nr:unnamed protein product [Paramecium pentaurelia]